MVFQQVNNNISLFLRDLPSFICIWIFFIYTCPYIPMLPQDTLSGESSDIRAGRIMR